MFYTLGFGFSFKKYLIKSYLIWFGLIVDELTFGE